MWDSGTSHSLLPLDQLTKGATYILKAIVKLAVGHAPALFWTGEVLCEQCRTQLVPANKVVQVPDLVSVVNGRLSLIHISEPTRLDVI
eukprot:9002017-Prorocentrum_lima.AAC.1